MRGSGSSRAISWENFSSCCSQVCLDADGAEASQLLWIYCAALSSQYKYYMGAAADWALRLGPGEVPVDPRQMEQADRLTQQQQKKFFNKPAAWHCPRGTRATRSPRGPTVLCLDCLFLSF